MNVQETVPNRAQEPPRATVMYPALCPQHCQRKEPTSSESSRSSPDSATHRQGTLEIFVSSPDEIDIITLVTLLRKKVKF